MRNPLDTPSIAKASKTWICDIVFDQLLEFPEKTKMHFTIPYLDVTIGNSIEMNHSASNFSTTSNISLSCDGKCPGIYDNVYAELDPNSIAGCEMRDGPHCVDPSIVDPPFAQYKASDYLQVLKLRQNTQLSSV